MVPVQRLHHVVNGAVIRAIARNQPPHCRGLERHGIVHAVRREVRIRSVDPGRIAKIGKLRFPIVSLMVQLAREVQEFGIAVPIVKPQHAQDLIVPAKHRPLLERAFIQMLRLKRKVFLQGWDNPGIAAGLVILRDCFQHHEIRPPVFVLCWSPPAFRRLVLQDPVHPFLYLRYETWIIRQIREWDEAI